MDPYYRTEEWKNLRRRVVKRDGGVCFYCTERGHQADHIVPRSYGGRDGLSNLVCCCARCNKLLRSQYFVSKSEKKRWIQSQLTGRPYKPGKVQVRYLANGMTKAEYREANASWPSPWKRQQDADAELARWLAEQSPP
jgi:hypothetical protein